LPEQVWLTFIKLSAYEHRRNAEGCPDVSKVIVITEIDCMN